MPPENIGLTVAIQVAYGADVEAGVNAAGLAEPRREAPRVVLRTIDDVVQEPWEFLTVDVEDAHQGAVMQELGMRKGELADQALERRQQVPRVVVALPVPGANGALGYQLLDHPEATMAAYWDRVFLDWTRFGLGNHLWASAVTWDPEGTLSTAGAVGTVTAINSASSSTPTSSTSSGIITGASCGRRRCRVCGSLIGGS